MIAVSVYKLLSFASKIQKRLQQIIQCCTHCKMLDCIYAHDPFLSVCPDPWDPFSVVSMASCVCSVLSSVCP